MTHQRFARLAAAGLVLAAALAWRTGSAGAVDLPVVRSLSPASGSTTGGVAVTITGTGLQSVTGVRFGEFGDSNGTDVHANSDGTSLTVTTPPAPVGRVAVTVTSGEGIVVAPEFSYAPTGSLQNTPPGWIVAARSVTDFAGVNRSTVLDQLNNPGTHVVVGSGAAACAGPALSVVPHAVPTASFTSYAAFAALMQQGELPSCITAVLHDPEAWKFTPLTEQQHPDDYARQFAALAHQHALTVIEAPAQNLVLTLGQNRGESRAQAFLRHGLAATAARYSDIAEFQVQGNELDHRAYSSTVAAFLEQARQADPGAIVQAGLATNPNGANATPEQMYQAALSTQDDVTGFWLNDAQRWAGCPQCSGPYPERAVDFLNYVDRQ